MSRSDVLFDALQQALLAPRPIVVLRRRVKRLEAELSKAKADLADALRMRAGVSRAKPKTLTPGQINVVLSRARREQSSVNWGVLTDEQEKCARLKWQGGLSVSIIARSLGKHRKTVDEHLDRARAKLERESQRDRNRKRGAVTKHGLAS